MTRLSDKTIKSLAAPATGNLIHWDDAIKGLGVRVTAAGHRAFILNYRTKAGRQRRLTIGSPPAWNLSAARDEAAKLCRKIDAGEDPLGNLTADRQAPTVA